MDMDTKDRVHIREQISRLLPSPLRQGVEGADGAWWDVVEELRLRIGQPMMAVTPKGEVGVKGCAIPVGREHLMRMIEISTQASVHTALAQVNQGFVTVEGGHRMGICGRVHVKVDGSWHMTQISSLSLRVARARYGAATLVLPPLFSGGQLENTLILAPPGLGKTTLLRDMMRAISYGDGCHPMRVGVADQRGELCGMWQGCPQFDIGPRTDVLDGCPKSEGLMALLRGMNPQVLIVDEITHPEDIEALEMAAHCGVALLATAHGQGMADLTRRPLYQRLLERGIFTKVIFIERVGEERRYRVAPLDGGVL